MIEELVPFPNKRPNDLVWKEIKDIEVDHPPYLDGEDEEVGTTKMCLVFVPIENRVHGMFYPYYMAELHRERGSVPMWYDEEGCPLLGITHYAELHYFL